MASTCLLTSRGLLHHIRNSIRWNLYAPTQSIRKLSAEANSPPQYTENELKLCSEIETLTKETDALKEKCATLDDKYKRSLADSENLRRRLTKQIDDAKMFGIQNFCKDLLNVADILHRATESVPADQVNTNTHLKGLYEGLKMTEAEMLKVFGRFGLSQVNPLDEKFDPNQHEALFEQSIPGKEAGTVIIVTKVGYKLHERVIRPALVGVAK